MLTAVKTLTSLLLDLGDERSWKTTKAAQMGKTLVDRAACLFVVLGAGGLACSGVAPPIECTGSGTAGASTTLCASGGMSGTGGASGGSANGAADSGTCTLLDDIDPDRLPPIDFGHYHSQTEMESYFAELAAAFPSVAAYRVLGQSVEGRDLFYLVINATCQDRPPAFLGIGAHHGDEKPSAEVVLATADSVLRQANSPDVRELLSRYSLYLLPLMNPDGYAASTRSNANGMDLNRDYAYPGRDDASSFKQPETQLVKTLQDSVEFHAAITYHSGTLEVLWPWCYTGEGTADEAFFVAAGQAAASAMGFDVYQQSYDDYPSQGEYIDYAYWKDRTLVSTFEVTLQKTPPEATLASAVANTWNGTLAWLQAVSDRDDGSTAEPPVRGPARPRFPLQAPVDASGKLE